MVLTGIVYILWSVGARHLARDLLPQGKELSGSHLRQEIRKQLRWRVP
jgi:hypothetical protein